MVCGLSSLVEFGNQFCKPKGVLFMGQMAAVAKDNKPRAGYFAIKMLAMSQRHLRIVVAPDEQRLPVD